MPSDKRPAALLIVWVLAVASVAATPGLAVGESLLAAAPQDPSAGEASLELQRPARRLIQQGLRNEGFDPGHTGRPVWPADGGGGAARRPLAPRPRVPGLRGVPRDGGAAE